MRLIKLVSISTKLICLMPYALCLASPAAAYTYNRDGVGLRLNGYGTAGAAFPEPLIYDYRVRGQANYAVRGGWTLGAVYSFDRLAYEFDRYYSDAFIFAESPYGRTELGWTESVAAKLGLGLPDVGALRMNNTPILYKVTDTSDVISNSTLTGTRYSFRATAVSLPTNVVQAGMSVSPFDTHFNSATDVGIKFRQPHGKTKLALSAAAGFVDSPRDLNADIYTAPVTADSRMQAALGANVQYTSWNFGATVRGIYDHNAITRPSDGLQTGVGASYDFLAWSASVSYILSNVGIWGNHPDYPNSTTTHTGIVSLRYKIDEYFEMFGSGGAVSSPGDVQPFVAAGLHGKF